MTESLDRYKQQVTEALNTEIDAANDPAPNRLQELINKKDSKYRLTEEDTKVNLDFRV